MTRSEPSGTLPPNAFSGAMIVHSPKTAFLPRFAGGPPRPVAAALSLLLLALPAGCGSGAGDRTHVGAIAFTDANGNPVAASPALNPGDGIYLDVLIGNDPQNLGANWSVSCSSELPPGTPLPPGQPIDTSCGFFTPVHTASAPVPSFATSGSGIVTFYQAPTTQPKGGTVTLYASSTTNPANFSSITLSIMP